MARHQPRQSCVWVPEASYFGRSLQPTSRVTAATYDPRGQVTRDLARRECLPHSTPMLQLRLQSRRQSSSARSVQTPYLRCLMAWR